MPLRPGSGGFLLKFFRITIQLWFLGHHGTAVTLNPQDGDIMIPLHEASIFLGVSSSVPKSKTFWVLISAECHTMSISGVETVFQIFHVGGSIWSF